MGPPKNCWRKQKQTKKGPCFRESIDPSPQKKQNPQKARVPAQKPGHEGLEGLVCHVQKVGIHLPGECNPRSFDRCSSDSVREGLCDRTKEGRGILRIPFSNDGEGATQGANDRGILTSTNHTGCSVHLSAVLKLSDSHPKPTKGAADFASASAQSQVRRNPPPPCGTDGENCTER